jgi:hypothetical protein
VSVGGAVTADPDIVIDQRGTEIRLATDRFSTKVEGPRSAMSRRTLNPSAFPAVSTAKSLAVTTRRTWRRVEDIVPDAGI